MNSLEIRRIIRSGFLVVALSAVGMLFVPRVEGQACLLADYHTAPIYDCVCGSTDPDCYAECGSPGPNDPCLDDAT